MTIYEVRCKLCLFVREQMNDVRGKQIEPNCEKCGKNSVGVFPVMTGAKGEGVEYELVVVNKRTNASVMNGIAMSSELRSGNIDKQKAFLAREMGNALIAIMKNQENLNKLLEE